MIELLAKLFIKNSSKFSDTSVRRKYGMLCGAVGIFFNIILCVSKLTVGFISHSVSIIADGFNHLSDSASSLVALLGFKIASKEPDSAHPFGHGRMEYVAGLVISFFILLMGIELLQTSIKSFFSHQTFEFSTISFAVMGGSVFVKFYMFIYNSRIARKIESETIEAAAKDSLSDIISTSVVIVAMISSSFTDFPVDAVAGIIVAGFILKTGYESATDTVSPLLGKAPSKEFVHSIEEIISSYPEILGFHDLIVHNYGPGRIMISVHAEVSGERNLFESHDVIDACENAIAKKLNCSAVIHIDPVETNNQQLNELKLILFEELNKIDSRITFHDLRLIPGAKQTKLIFEIVKPFDSNFDDKTLRRRIQAAISRRAADVKCVIEVETPLS